jgi:hypothetical protein
MIAQPSEEEVQACLSLYERLQTYLDEANAYDRITTDECVSEDVHEQITVEEEDIIHLDPATLEDAPSKVKDPIEKVNMGTDKEPMEVAISTYLKLAQKQGLISLLLEFKDCFAETYEDMSARSFT